LLLSIEVGWGWWAFFHGNIILKSGPVWWIDPKPDCSGAGTGSG